MTTLRQPDHHDSSDRHLPVFFLSLNSPQVNNPLFILHRVFTRYHTEIKREKRKVNSVNNQIKKNFFRPV
ncbi:hypothetical protein PU33_19465 [Escherichia coli]|nr:hypothetical protein RG56_23330 [Escherichia coli]APL15554.1 hypothetical protein RG58_21915 [Escherichia coli]APL24438.1 hypothetical protein RG60_17490 [Escherichia coli]APL30373.1 hypothetical protein RG61_21670 [Escherichia coli]APL39574.1 hypothetical protein RG63_19095 [Escherichia coli]